MYQVEYYIEFVALDEKKYRIELLRESMATLTPIPLRGAVSPIETVEDNSDNIFIPIRKQTGKLCIADNGKDMNGNDFDYTTLIPNNIFEYQVRLWSIASDLSETLRWIGYIKPDALTSRIFEAVTIREFQITCPLGAMYDTPVSFSNTASNTGTVKTIGQILHTALTSTGVAWEYVYKQNTTKEREDLIAKISLLNFVDNEPTHTNPASEAIDTFTATWGAPADVGTKWADIVEDICRFWGWTLYSRGLDIYIVAQNQYPKFAKFAFANLTADYKSQMGDIEDVYVDLQEELTYTSTNHTESRQLGYSMVKVQNNVNEHETVVDPDFQKLPMSYWRDGYNGVVHHSNDYYYILRRWGYSNDQQTTRSAFTDNYQVYESRAMPNGINALFVLYYSDGWDNEEYPNKAEFNLSRGIACYAAGNAVRPTFFVKTLEDVILPKGSVICIEANAELSYSPDPDFPTGGFTTGAKPSISDAPLSNANTTGPYSEVKNIGTNENPLWDIVPKLEGRTITVALCIGNKYWDADHNEWTNALTTFNLTIRKDGSITSPQNYGQSGLGILFNDHYGSRGFCIPNNNTADEDAICGRLKLMVYNNIETDLPASHLFNCMLTNLQVGIYNTDSKLYPQAKASHTFKKAANSVFQRELSVSLNMAAGDKNKYGLGQLYTPDLSILATVPFRTDSYQWSDKQPEEQLLDTMVNCYSYVTFQNTIEVRDDARACLPNAKFVAHWADTAGVYHLQCVSHKWRDATMKLTLINK